MKIESLNIDEEQGYGNRLLGGLRNMSGEDAYALIMRLAEKGELKVDPSELERNKSAYIKRHDIDKENRRRESLGIQNEDPMLERIAKNNPVLAEGIRTVGRERKSGIRCYEFQKTHGEFLCLPTFGRTHIGAIDKSNVSYYAVIADKLLKYILDIYQKSKVNINIKTLENELCHKNALQYIKCIENSNSFEAMPPDFTSRSVLSMLLRIYSDLDNGKLNSQDILERSQSPADIEKVGNEFITADERDNPLPIRRTHLDLIH